MKKTIFTLFAIIMIVLSFVSCSNNQDIGIINEENTTIIIASSQMDADIDHPQYWVRTPNTTTWNLFDNDIIGFNYEPGYEYEIAINKLFLGSNIIKYKLVDIIRKEKKKSIVPKFTYNVNDIPKDDILSYSDDMSFTTLSNGEIIGTIDSFYIYQGDILLTKQQIEEIDSHRTRSLVAIASNSIHYWPNGIVYYTFANGFTKTNNVLQAISEYENNTVLRFIQGTGNGNYIEFHDISGNVSNSHVGMVGGKQLINLATNSSVGTAIHEIGHAIGLQHEHCRSDRDDYITVLWSNISPSNYSYNFVKDLYSRTVGNFDFSSIMIYGSFSFASSFTQPSMITKNGEYFYRQNDGLSLGDIEGIKSIYGPPIVMMKLETQETYSYTGVFEDYQEYDATYTIKFYSDYTYSQEYPLDYQRTVKITTQRDSFETGDSRIQTSMTSNYITIPAGVSSYSLGTVHNKEYYYQGNPELIDVTSYGVN